MPFLILAVVLAIMQTSAPVPRKAADHSAGTGQSVKQHSQTDQKPATQPSSGIKTISPNPYQESSQSVAAPNAQESIQVRELPPVSVAKDWMDRTAWAFTFALLIVGSFGVRAAYRTLKAIEKQATLMAQQTSKLDESIAVAKDNAQAALLNAQTLMSAERARIDVELAPGGGTLYFLCVSNEGRSPAHIDTYTLARHHFPLNPNQAMPLPEHFREMQFVTERHFINRMLPAGKRENMLTIDLGKFVSEAQRAGREQAIYRGVVNYQDIFDEEHETELVYRYDLPPSGKLVNLPQHNRYT